MSKKYNICLIKGDGIGPEVIDCVVRISEHLNLNLNFDEAFAGFEAYEKYGTPLPDSTVQKARNADAILFGAVTTPPNISGYFSPIVKLRKDLNLYANVRPFFSLPVPASRENVNLVIIRENTEDLYIGRELEIEGGIESIRLTTKRAAENIIRFAFTYARNNKRHKVGVIHKANVIRKGDGLFLKTAQDISSEFPEIEHFDMLVDSCAMNLVLRPEIFDVIVTTNMFGDILSDEAAGLVGGLGVACSANIGEINALFEPVHGSAPDIAGKGISNPTACILSFELMLKHFGEFDAATCLKSALFKTLQSGAVTQDLGGSLGTKEFESEVIKNLKEVISGK